MQQRIVRLREHSPDDPHALLFQGDLHAIVDEDELARVLYARAIARDPGLAHGYYSLGVVLDKLGEAEKALGAYEQAVKLAPEYGPYRNNLAHQYVQLKDYEQAITVYEKVLALEADFVLPYFDLANCYRVRGRLEEALRSQQKGALLSVRCRLLGWKISSRGTSGWVTCPCTLTRWLVNSAMLPAAWRPRCEASNASKRLRSTSSKCVR